MKETDAELIQGRIRDLCENTDFNATLFESLVGYAVIAADFDGNIIAYNEGARQIYGYDPEEICGRRNIDVFFPRDFIEGGYYQQLVDVLLATGRFSYEGDKVRRSGKRFPAQILFTLTKNKSDKVVGFVEIVQDLTDRKLAEEELCRHRDHLEVLVEQRTAELEQANRLLQAEIVERKRAEAELRQRAQELVEADQRKDQFLAMLAHELRNPLAPIMNGLQILRRADAHTAGAEQVRAMMERQIRQLSRLVDDLLDVSRITQGKIHVQRERLDLAALVRTTTEDRRPLLEGVGIKLVLEAPATPVWVTGDATRLAQVLNNLLDNAVKFRNGDGSVTVRLTVDASRQEALLEVRDQGIGIAPDLLPRLFDAFVQGDRSLDRARGGLGLGLALVKGLVELHGGTVQAASGGPERGGASFIIRMPLGDEGVALSAQPLTPAPPAARPLRILIVDDSHDAAESLRLLLTLLGHDVRVAYDGPVGVKQARAWRPDAILCDIGLPGMDGYGVASTLRHDPATADTHLIALTGYGQDEDRRRSQLAGFKHHLTKPADPVLLQRLLAEIR